MTAPPPTDRPNRRRNLRDWLTANRPRLPLVFLAHPFELAIATVLANNVIRSGLSSSSTLHKTLPTPVLVLWLLTGSLAFGLIVAGLRWRHTAFGRALEKAGLWLIAGVAVVLAVVFLSRLPFEQAWSGALSLFVYAAACTLRIVAIRRTERIVLEELRKADPAAIRRIVDGRPPVGPR